jgi:predicted nucleic acid-binding protein
MCAIVDVNVSHEIFGDNRPEAGEKFFKWLDSGSLRLVVSRKLLAELNYGKAQQWIQQAILAGRVRQETTVKVDEREEKLIEEGRCHSNDTHVIALAQISGARLLYSNDKALHEDFGNKRMIDKPRGKVYSTNERKDFTSVHARLLNNRNLCRNR